MKSKNDGPRIQYARIPLDTRTMARMSMDIKEMPESELGFRYILVCICEFTNWMKAIPLIHNPVSRNCAINSHYNFTTIPNM